MDSYVFLVHANETSEWIWQFYFKFMATGVISTIIFVLISIYLCWLSHDMVDATYLYHPFKVMLVVMRHEIFDFKF